MQQYLACKLFSKYCLFPGVSYTGSANNKNVFKVAWFSPYLYLCGFIYLYTLFGFSSLLQSFHIITHLILPPIKLSFYACSVVFSKNVGGFFCVPLQMLVPFVSWCTWMCFSVCRESGKKPQADGEAAAAAGARPRDFCLPRWPKRHVPHKNGYILYTCMHLVAGLGVLWGCRFEKECQVFTCALAKQKQMSNHFFNQHFKHRIHGQF